MNIDDIYTPIEDAKIEIEKRWNDEGLKKKVDTFFGNSIPELLQEKPRAYLARHISSPNFEFVLFKEFVNKIGMDYLLSEYNDDIFAPENSLKYHLGKMFFEGNVGKNGGRQIRTELVIDFNSSNGRRIKDIKTKSGHRLVDFHRSLVEKHDKDSHEKIYDFSEFLGKFENDTALFYRYFLALFIRNGILFENFLLNDEERRFTIQNVLPNIEFIKRTFGVKPLIVRLLPKDAEEDIHWLCYPKELFDSV